MSSYRLQRQQVGQVLIMSLAMMTIGVAGLLFMFDAGQTIESKSRLVDATDAAAFSAASWRARVFNFIAYSNRAIIAQEVAVAQAVTLDSYAHYFASFADSVDKLANLYPPAKVVTEAVAQAAEYAKNITTKAAGVEIALRDAPSVGYKTLLQHSQRVLRSAAGTFGASAVANEVAKATDSRFFAFALPDSNRYSQFTRRYKSSDDRKRMRTVVLNSLDAFTSGERTQTQHLASFACLPIEYRKRGGTILTPDLERWESGDTGSIHGGIKGIFSGCRGREWYPMGWGGSEASDSYNVNRFLGNPGDAKSNPQAFRNAENEFGGSHTGTGIAKSYGLSNIAGIRNQFPRSRVTILASLPGRRIRLAQNIGSGTGALNKSPRWAAKKVWAIAAAEVYFQRPPDAPARIEYANLYNPYWQTRLVSVTDGERQKAGGYGAK